MYVGSLNGPLQANNGLVSATSSIGVLYGGTGLTSYTAGDVLYADANGNLARLPIGGTGQVLKVNAGFPSWGADQTTGGSGGATAWATTTDSLAIYPSDTSNVVIIGNSATSTLNSIFEVQGKSYFSNNVGIGSTSPTQLLSVGGNGYFAGNVTATNITATGTLTAQNASRKVSISAVLMAFCTARAAALGSLQPPPRPPRLHQHPGAGTSQLQPLHRRLYHQPIKQHDQRVPFLDRLEQLQRAPLYHLARHDRQGLLLLNTSAQYLLSQTDTFSTTSAMYFANSSTTIPKTYSTNTFTEPTRSMAV